MSSFYYRSDPSLLSEPLYFEVYIFRLSLSSRCCPSLLASSDQCPLPCTNKRDWVDCWQRLQTKSCVKTSAHALAHHGPLICWLMASFSVIHPSTSHPSLLSPSVLQLQSPVSYSPESISCLGIYTDPKAPLLFYLPSFFLISLISFCHSPVDYSRFLLHTAGRASCVESCCVWRALLSLCTTRLCHANLWLALHWGLLTTHGCLHATPLWIEEITLTLTLRAQTPLVDWHNCCLSHSYSIHEKALSHKW